MPYAPTTKTYDVITTIRSVGFTADDWLAGPVSPSAILDLIRYGLRPPERARRASNLMLGLAGPDSPSAILDLIRYGLRPLERARRASNLMTGLLRRCLALKLVFTST
ncbi:hypothetical protein ElyMa_003605100 [Elysia marginata]|uniref:Uncharacterized protein n=1 Tax=Elysia marginata TaxID=1093978 RepID=A0AAV4ER52_9GAST|nr:hypothetical protein ElyMa_003605100 [Elysia marginata]